MCSKTRPSILILILRDCRAAVRGGARDISCIEHRVKDIRQSRLIIASDRISERASQYPSCLNGTAAKGTERRLVLNSGNAIIKRLAAKYVSGIT